MSTAFGLIPGASVTTDNLDAFGRLRTGDPLNVFDSKQIFDAQPLLWDTVTTGTTTGTTYNSGQASYTLAVLGNQAGSVIRQTFRRFNYQSGKSQLILLTGIIGPSGGTGVTRRIGQFDGAAGPAPGAGANGIFFESNATDIRIVIRTSTGGTGSDATYATQANWNIDKLDGKGPSGVTADWSKTQIFAICYEWLGVGSVWGGVVVGGKIIWCHRFDNANVNTLVYMATPNNPLRYEAYSAGTGTATTYSMLHICSAVSSEGGSPPTGQSRGVARLGGAALVRAGNNVATYYVLAVLRLRSGYYGSQISDLSVTLDSTTTNARYLWALMLNPTLSGAPAYTTVANSECEADVATNNLTVTSPNTIVMTGYGSQANGVVTQPVPSDVRLGINAAGTTPDTLVLAVVNTVLAATNDYLGGFNWRSGC